MISCWLPPGVTWSGNPVPERSRALAGVCSRPTFSAADVQMSFPLEAAAGRGGLDDKWPHLMDFLKRIHARPAYKRALERGGEYGIVGG